MNTESEDARRVDVARECLGKRDVAGAKAILVDVISRTPQPYSKQVRGNGKIGIKFWSVDDFIGYVQRRDKTAGSEDINWLPNAYPQAHFLLGALALDADNVPAASLFLESALALEPDNPHILCGMGDVLTRQKRFGEAEARFGQALSAAGGLSAPQKAAALRGLGQLHLERQQPDEAERLFREAMDLGDDSGKARAQLARIAAQRRASSAPVGKPAPSLEGSDIAIDLSRPPENIDEARILLAAVGRFMIHAQTGDPELNEAVSKAAAACIVAWSSRASLDCLHRAQAQGNLSPIMQGMPPIAAVLHRALEMPFSEEAKLPMQFALSNYHNTMASLRHQAAAPPPRETPQTGRLRRR